MIEAGLWLGIAAAMIVWLAYRLHQAQKANQAQHKAWVTLKQEYDKLERRLDRRGRRLDVLLSTISEAVLRVDEQGRVLGGNEQADALFHLQHSIALPQSMMVFYRDSEWLKAFQQAIDALPEQKTLPEMKVNGRVLLPRLAALSDKEALLLCLDVTAYTRLQQKQKSLLENLMHDLKTPLTSLLGYARSMETFADDEALRQEAIGVIVKEAKHINNLMHHMLTLNHIENHQRTQGRCEVGEVCQQVWDTLHCAMQQKSVTLHLDISPEVKGVQVAMADVDCRRVLMNIAENAVKFSPEHGEIYCAITGDERGVWVCIQDQGYGIPEAHIKRVTERFYRVDHVRGRKQKEGHGLGLAIVKETLKRDGGALTLENHDAGGLIVRVLLPQWEK